MSECECTQKENLAQKDIHLVLSTSQTDSQTDSLSLLRPRNCRVSEQSSGMICRTQLTAANGLEDKVLLCTTYLEPLFVVVKALGDVTAGPYDGWAC